jgi:hypothetical protein
MPTHTLESAVSRRLTLWTLTGLLAGFSPEILAAGQRATPSPKRPPLTVECTKFAGTIMLAPAWKSELDGTTNQVLRLEYGSDRKGRVSWLQDGKTYHTIEGIAVELRTGFAILVPADEYVETYVYNPGSAEVLFTSTRSGSQLGPNSIKAFRGTCTAGSGGK